MQNVPGSVEVWRGELLPLQEDKHLISTVAFIVSGARTSHERTLGRLREVDVDDTNRNQDRIPDGSGGCHLTHVNDREELGMESWCGSRVD
jgi:hypothetical protein